VTGHAAPPILFSPKLHYVSLFSLVASSHRLVDSEPDQPSQRLVDSPRGLLPRLRLGATAGAAKLHPRVNRKLRQERQTAAAGTVRNGRKESVREHARNTHEPWPCPLPITKALLMPPHLFHFPFSSSPPPLLE
jgi:hypothetical protein